MISILINGKEIPLQEIAAWEQKRLAWSARFLKSRLGSKLKIDTIKDLTAFKLNISENEMRRTLKDVLALSGFLSKMMVRLSFGKRKSAVTEILIKGGSAQTLSDGFHKMMLTNTDANRVRCLAACPDHYLLKGCGGNVQEVIEVAGSMPLPLQFFVTYGDESALNTPKDSGYPLQAAGTARLSNGFVMGGVRHQMKDTPEGCAVRLTVEFPVLLPSRCIKEHRLHLACEFMHWFEELQKDFTNDL